MTSSTGSEPTSRPIVEIRAVNYTWAEPVEGRPGSVEAIVRVEYRVEIRRDGEENWTQIELIERQGKPPG